MHWPILSPAQSLRLMVSQGAGAVLVIKEGLVLLHSHSCIASWPVAISCRYYDRVAAQEALIEQKLSEEKEEEEDDELTPEQIWMVGGHGCHLSFICIPICRIVIGNTADYLVARCTANAAVPVL